MVLTKIPHFREVMVCSFECPHCGNRSVIDPMHSCYQPGVCLQQYPALESLRAWQEQRAAVRGHVRGDGRALHPGPAGG